MVVCVLSAFDIGPALDEDGNPQAPKVEYDSVAVRYVFMETLICTVGMLTITRRYIRGIKPFECTIKPRSDDAIKLVKEACDRTNY